MKKSELRKLYLERRRSLTTEEIAQKSREIAVRFFDSFDLTVVRTLHCYVSIRKFNEVETSLIYRKIWADFPGIRTVTPRVMFQTGELDSVIFSKRTNLVENDWGIQEVPVGETVEPDVIDLVLIPLLCYDLSGNRVGYGKGYYDRFLAKCRPDCLKVGLSLFEPEPSIDDLTSFDVGLDHIITPIEIVTPIK